MNKRRVKPEHERREEIINAAYAVIYEVGLSNTTIAQIAKKAQLSTGIVSHYFGDKQGLIHSCMRHGFSIVAPIGHEEREQADAHTARGGLDKISRRLRKLPNAEGAYQALQPPGAPALAPSLVCHGGLRNEAWSNFLRKRLGTGRE